MNNEGILAVQALETAFEAIKAKHQSISRCASPSDPLLLELADMILLFSAQLTLAVKVSGKRRTGLKGGFSGVKSRHPIH